MPAKSKSQQRLMGMVHAYNKGEFHGTPELRRFVARVADGISDDDARHFAETSHSGLPEKKAQAVQLAQDPDSREYNGKKPSVIGSALKGTILGTALGGLGAGGLGFLLTHGVAKDKGLSDSEALKAGLNGFLAGGSWGATRGAGLGAIGGLGHGIYSKFAG